MSTEGIQGCGRVGGPAAAAQVDADGAHRSRAKPGSAFRADSHRCPRSTAILLLTLILTGACRQRAAENDGEGPAEGPDAWRQIIRSAGLREGQLAWGPFAIGMTLEQVRQAAAEPVTLEQRPAPGCGEHFARIQHDGPTLTLQFSGSQPSAELQSIFAGFHAARGDREAMVEALRRQIEGLAFEPGRHQPQLGLEEDPTPQFLVTGHPQQAVLLKPETGIYLSLAACLD